MIKIVFSIQFALFLFYVPLMAQQTGFLQKDSDVEARLKKDIYTLASDSFMGREAGTDGEIMARDYIIRQYKQIGLKPLFGDTSYFQSFDVNGSAKFSEYDLVINSIPFEFTDDFYPLDFSANDKVKAEAVRVGFGMSVPSKGWEDYKKDVKDKIVIIEIAVPDSLKKIKEFTAYTNLRKKAETAVSKGAKGVVFINSSKTCQSPPKYASNNTKPIGIPVVFASEGAYKMIKATQQLKIEMNVAIERQKSKTAYNVGAYLDNNAPFTIIIGGHYDHLGYVDGPKGKPIVSNGADDNASGTSAMMEMARFFSDTAKEKYNFIFMGFSAEEKGLVGSEFFTKSNTIDLSSIAFMINLDMIGRLDSTKKQLTIYSFGTSPAWGKITSITDSAGLKILEKKECHAGSDHYSFYSKNIPNVFFFTELHKDYHKPSDDVNKINYAGLVQIVAYIERFIGSVKSGKKLPFTRVEYSF